MLRTKIIIITQGDKSSTFLLPSLLKLFPNADITTITSEEAHANRSKPMKITNLKKIPSKESIMKASRTQIESLWDFLKLDREYEAPQPLEYKKIGIISKLYAKNIVP